MAGISRANVAAMSTLTFSCNRLADDAADGLVETKHIQKYATDLGQVEATDRGARGNIGFQHVREDFDVIRVAQHVDVLCSLCHQRVPLQIPDESANTRNTRITYNVVRQLHQFRDQFLLLRLIRLSRYHVSDSLVERVHLPTIRVSAIHGSRNVDLLVEAISQQ